TAYKVRTSSTQPPEKWETGTPSFEAIAGTLGALEYMEWIGEQASGEKAASRRARFAGAMDAICRSELELSKAIIEGLQTVPGLRIWGITDPSRLDHRVATVSFTLEGHQPSDVAYALGCENIYVWNGNFYALEVTTTLGLEDQGGLVRVGAVHYNTQAEVSRLIEVLGRIAGQ